MSKKISWLIFCAILLPPLPAWAQQAGKMFRIGFLELTTASGSAGLWKAFQQELTKLGWIEGKNITINHRFAEHKSERLPGLAADLVHLKVDVIVCGSAASALAAKGATTAIPIVFGTAADPIGLGLVASLARPGGNVTGFSSLDTELNSKRLEILKDAVPKLSRVGLLLQLGRPDAALREIRACGYGAEAKIGGDRDSSRRPRFREGVSSGETEAGGRDHDDRRSPL